MSEAQQPSDNIPVIPIAVIEAEIITQQQPTHISIGDIVVKINNAPVHLDNETIAKIIEVINMLGNNQQIILSRVATLEISVSQLQVQLKQLEG